MESYIELTGLTWNNFRVNEYELPDREITDGMLYHIFASGLFELVKVKRTYDSVPHEYNRPQMQNYVQQRDRLEIRKLQAELAEARAQQRGKP